jgi:hypothetical protein
VSIDDSSTHGHRTRQKRDQADDLKIEIHIGSLEAPLGLRSLRETKKFQRDSKKRGAATGTVVSDKMKGN